VLSTSLELKLFLMSLIRESIITGLHYQASNLSMRLQLYSLRLERSGDPSKPNLEVHKKEYMFLYQG